MIASIVKLVLTALFVGFFLAIVGFVTICLIVVLAIVKFRAENGEIYDDEENK